MEYSQNRLRAYLSVRRFWYALRGAMLFENHSVKGHKYALHGSAKPHEVMQLNGFVFPNLIQSCMYTS